MKPYRKIDEPQTETPQQAWWRIHGPSLARAFIVAIYACAFAAVMSIETPRVFAVDGGVATAVVEVEASATAASETAPVVGTGTAGGLPDTSKLVTTGSATADGPIGPDADAAQGLSIVVQLLRMKEWKLAIGAILMLLLTLTRNFWAFIPKGWKPHFVAATSGVAVVGSGLLAGMPVVEALWAGAQVAAFTGWLYGLLKGLLAKLIPGMKKKAVA